MLRGEAHEASSFGEARGPADFAQVFLDMFRPHVNTMIWQSGCPAPDSTAVSISFYWGRGQIPASGGSHATDARGPQLQEFKPQKSTPMCLVAGSKGTCWIDRQ